MTWMGLRSECDPGYGAEQVVEYIEARVVRSKSYPRDAWN